MPTKAICHDRV